MARHARLYDASVLLAGLSKEIPTAKRRIGDLLARQPWPSDTMAGSVSGGDISDPTGNNAVQEWLEDMDGLDEATRDVITAIDTLAVKVRRVWDPVRKQAERTRSLCHGGQSMKGGLEWGDEQCDEFAATSPTGEHPGLCKAHDRARRRWDARQEWHRAGMEDPTEGLTDQQWQAVVDHGAAG